MADTFLRFIFLGILLLYQAANADVLVLKNGDRITGEIKRIWDSEITIEPEYSDEFKVDVTAVDHIESDREFEIELEDGTSLVAKLDGADSDGNQLVTAGEETIAVSLAELFELDEPEDDFDWESNVEFSAAFSSGNTDSSNTKLRADTTVKFPDHRHIGGIRLFHEDLAGVTTKEQDLFKYNYNWLFRDPWFFSVQLSFERDPIIELEERVILSAGIGRDIWNTPRQELSLQLGAGAQTEEIGPVSTDSAVLTWSLRYRQDFFSDDLELYHNHSITSNIGGRANTSYITTTGLRYEITDLLYANLSVDFDYETDPVDVAENEDVALLVGLGLEF
jgi:putative salt-induced outer membrane protein YdiY